MKYTGVFYTVFMVQITTVAKISQSTMFYDSSNFQMTVKYETIAEGGGKHRLRKKSIFCHFPIRGKVEKYTFRNVIAFFRMRLPTG